MPTELEEYESEWHHASEREKISRSRFAQHSMKPDEVSRELKEARRAAGSPEFVKEFVLQALKRHRASILGGVPVKVNLSDLPTALKDTLDIHQPEVKISFDPTHVPADAIYVSRSSPVTDGLASFVMDGAMDPLISDSAATRAGVARTNSVDRKTTLLIVRFRYQITTITPDSQQPLLSEECRLMAFRGSPDSPEWLTPEEAEALLDATPDRNIPADQQAHFLNLTTGSFSSIEKRIRETSKEQAEELLASHQRVRKIAGIKHVRYEVEPKAPDVIGIYIYLPVAGVQ